MAKISESKGRSDSNSGYARLFGSQQLGKLMSRVHAAVIRSGNELEKIIEAETPEMLKVTLDVILGQKSFFSTDTQVVFQARMPGAAGKYGETADTVIIDHKNQKILVIELKDGDTFDTKKSSGELESMINFANWIAQKTGLSGNLLLLLFQPG